MVHEPFHLTEASADFPDTAGPDEPPWHHALKYTPLSTIHERNLILNMAKRGLSEANARNAPLLSSQDYPQYPQSSFPVAAAVSDLP